MEKLKILQNCRSWTRVFRRDRILTLERGIALGYPSYRERVAPCEHLQTPDAMPHVRAGDQSSLFSASYIKKCNLGSIVC